MKLPRPFEIGLLILFAVLFVGSIILLKVYDPAKDDSDAVDLGGEVVIWGTLSDEKFNGILSGLNDEAEDLFRGVSYRYVPQNEFADTFVTALADQEQPDLLFMSSENLVEHRRRLQPISYELFPKRDFRDTYIDGASVFTLSDGIYALPIMVDPLVMYWNKDILSDRGFLTPPKTWEQMVNVYAPAITVRDFNRKIELSTLAMGGYSNVNNAFPILSTLLLQQDSVMVGENSGEYDVSLNQSVNNIHANPLLNSLNFYSSFSRINNSLYNWNRTLDLDRDLFLREDLAFYFGYGSEGRELETKNPNLSFDITTVPQSENGVNKRTYGKFYGLFMPKAAKNINGAYIVMNKLGTRPTAQKLADNYNMAPVHVKSLLEGNDGVYGRIIYKSALNTRAWLNPDLDMVDTIFANTLEDISSNRSSVESASSDIVNRIQQVY